MTQNSVVIERLMSIRIKPRSLGKDFGNHKENGLKVELLDTWGKNPSVTATWALALRGGQKRLEKAVS